MTSTSTKIPIQIRSNASERKSAPKTFANLLIRKGIKVSGKWLRGPELPFGKFQSALATTLTSDNMKKLRPESRPEVEQMKDLLT